MAPRVLLFPGRPENYFLCLRGSPTHLHNGLVLEADPVTFLLWEGFRACTPLVE